MRKLTIAAALVGASIAASASAHTTSLGYVPGTNPGEVTFWAGSYHAGGVNEGMFTLTNLDTMVSQTVAPNIGVTNVMPTGLVDGTNNFYWGYDNAYGYNTDQGIGGGVAIWQGITFSGLSAGNYEFTCGNTCGTSAVWATWSQGAVQLTLTGRDVGGSVPEPSTWAMLLLGFLGIGLTLRRNQGAVTRAKATTVRYV